MGTTGAAGMSLDIHATWRRGNCAESGLFQLVAYNVGVYLRKSVSKQYSQHSGNKTFKWLDLKSHKVEKPPGASCQTIFEA